MNLQSRLPLLLVPALMLLALPFIGSLGLVFFELLIVSLQAYVFVLLTAIYLESSLADSH